MIMKKNEETMFKDSLSLIKKNKEKQTKTK